MLFLDSASSQALFLGCCKKCVEAYLDAYQMEHALDNSHLAHYRVRRCVNALIQGAEGQVVWQHPLIAQDLLAYIRSVTDMQITMPG